MNSSCYKLFYFVKSLLARLSDASGKMKMTLEKTGKIGKSDFDTKVWAIMYIELRHFEKKLAKGRLLNLPEYSYLKCLILVIN